MIRTQLSGQLVLEDSSTAMDEEPRSSNNMQAYVR
jgi:hypothetical protein